MAQKLFILFGLMTLIASCQLTPSQLGENFEEKNIISIDDLIANLQTNHEIKDAQIAGTIYKTCLSEGCWFKIQDKNKNEIILRIKDKQFRMPNTSAEKKVVVLVDATLSDTTRTSDEWYAIEVKGIKFK